MYQMLRFLKEVSETCTVTEVMVQSTREEYGSRSNCSGYVFLSASSLKAATRKRSDMPAPPIRIKTFLFPCRRYIVIVKKLLT